MCEVKINSKQVDSVHLLISTHNSNINNVELTSDNELAVMDNMSERGTVKIDNKGKQHLTS